jgi:DNA-binding NtrC family response regulator
MCPAFELHTLDLAAPARSGTETAPPFGVPARIIVAEDDPAMLRTLVEVLKLDGYAVQAIRGGGGLLLQLLGTGPGERRADLVVSDIRMPTFTGLQVLAVVRAAADSTPFILMTGFGDDETRARAALLGAILFDKPFDIADLRLAVARILAPRDAEPRRGAPPDSRP